MRPDEYGGPDWCRIPQVTEPDGRVPDLCRMAGFPIVERCIVEVLVTDAGGSKSDILGHLRPGYRMAGWLGRLAGTYGKNVLGLKCKKL